MTGELHRGPPTFISARENATGGLLVAASAKSTATANAWAATSRPASQKSGPWFPHKYAGAGASRRFGRGGLMIRDLRPQAGRQAAWRIAAGGLPGRRRRSCVRDAGRRAVADVRHGAVRLYPRGGRLRGRCGRRRCVVRPDCCHRRCDGSALPLAARLPGLREAAVLFVCYR